MKVFLLAAMLCVACGQDDSKNETQEFKPSLWSVQDENEGYDSCVAAGDGQNINFQKTFCLCIIGYMSRTYEPDVFAANAVDIIASSQKQVDECIMKSKQINGEG